MPLTHLIHIHYLDVFKSLKKITNFRVSQRREEMLKDAYLAIRVFVTSITTNNLGGRLSYKLGYYGKELMRFLIYQAQKTMF